MLVCSRWTRHNDALSSQLEIARNQGEKKLKLVDEDTTFLFWLSAGKQVNLSEGSTQGLRREVSCSHWAAPSCLTHEATLSLSNRSHDFTLLSS